MTVHIAPMLEAEAAELAAPAPEAGIGALRTAHGNLPLELIVVEAKITGLVADVELTQGFVNPYEVPLEATYVFPLPDRGAVTRMRMEADDRVVEGVLQERGKARAEYDRAIAEGRRASIAEEERPDVFTMRVGNILPAERVTVRLTIAQPLPYADGDATFRFPLVVAPRYIPGEPLPDRQVGDGYGPDTDAVPDASRITPPVLLPGFPNPVRLSITVDVDPGGLPLGDVRCSLHEVDAEGSRIRLRPGTRADRDFVLRLAYGEPQASATACAVDSADQDGERTFQLTVLPPADAAMPRPRDVVVVLDRSGSMSGWKMVAARRAAARIVDSLTDADRFAVLTFDSVVERPLGLPTGCLSAATDRHRFRAVEHLAQVSARGGTEMLTPLREAISLLTDPERDRVLVLVTDGQVGNEDQLLRELSGALAGIRVHTIGIDRAVNAGFLTRLAGVGGGRCELVESEDRLDEAATRIHHRIAAPLLTGMRLAADAIMSDTVAPARLPDLFPGVPMVVSGRWRGAAAGRVTVSGRTGDGRDWRADVPVNEVANPALTAAWARSHLRDLEDRYLVGEQVENQIVATSLKFGVLCRFTAFVAVDSRVVTEGGSPHRVIQPVEPASGWAMLSEPPQPFLASPAMSPVARAATVGPMATTAGMEFGFASPQAGAVGRPRAFGKAAGPRLGRPAADPVAQARAQAREEVRRLRASAGVPEPERRALLADLGSRLDAMVIHLSAGGHAAVAAPLHELAEALRACDRPIPLPSTELERLWKRALQVLDAFAAGGAANEDPIRPSSHGPGGSSATGDSGTTSGRGRTAFWKRS